MSVIEWAPAILPLKIVNVNDAFLVSVPFAVIVSALGVGYYGACTTFFVLAKTLVVLEINVAPTARPARIILIANGNKSAFRILRCRCSSRQSLQLTGTLLPRHFATTFNALIPNTLLSCIACALIRQGKTLRVV